jgi:hypothetical protein
MNANYTYSARFVYFLVYLGTSGLIRDWRFSGLNDDDDGKNDGLKWKLAKSFRQRTNFFTANPLSSFKAKRTSISDRSFSMLIFMKENSHLKDSFNFVKKEAEL